MPALLACGPEFKPQYCQKKKERKSQLLFCVNHKSLKILVKGIPVQS
jgi:hypothetical protein